ncbi:MAG: hemolysin family protein [Cytophagales bacterium]
MIFDLFLVLVLVLLNAFFVAAEFAIVKVRESQIEIKAQTGNGLAKISKGILKNLNAYLSATQLGITLASLALGWIGEEAASEIVHRMFNAFGLDMGSTTVNAIAIGIAFFMITTLHIVLGEQVPKTLAISSPEKATYFITLPLRAFYVIFRPLIWALNGTSMVILRIFGVNTANGHTDDHSAEELKMLLEKGKEQGVIEQEEHELLENVFHFNETTVRQIMIPRTKMVALEVSASDEKILQMINNEGFSRMPVFKEVIDDVVGIISTKDILKMVSRGESIVLSNYLKPAYFIPDTKRINDLMKDFQKKRLHMAIVLDEFGGTSGIVTMEDIIEELVGEIQDEDDDEQKPLVEKITEKEIVVSGIATLSEVNEHLRHPLPEGDDFETMAGLMNFIFEKIPSDGDEKEFGGYHFTVLKMGNKIAESVRIVELLREDD